MLICFVLNYCPSSKWARRFLYYYNYWLNYFLSKRKQRVVTISLKCVVLDVTAWESKTFLEGMRAWVSGSREGKQGLGLSQMGTNITAIGSHERSVPTWGPGTGNGKGGRLVPGQFLGLDTAGRSLLFLVSDYSGGAPISLATLEVRWKRN